MKLDQDRPGASLLWKGQSRSEMPGETDGLHSMITTPIMEGDHVYGVCSYGELRALSAATGERVWHIFQRNDNEIIRASLDAADY